MKNHAVKCSQGTLLVPFGTIIVYHIFRKLQDGKMYKDEREFLCMLPGQLAPPYLRGALSTILYFVPL